MPASRSLSLALVLALATVTAPGIPADPLLGIDSTTEAEWDQGLEPGALAPLEVETEMAAESSGVGAVPAFDREGWGRFGAVAYPAAALYMWTRNGSQRSLTEYQKQKLRGRFGSLVDKITVCYGAKMLEEFQVGPWRVAFTHPSAGQTFGYRVYLRDPFDETNASQIELLAHELVHSRQYQARGASYARFGRDYFLGWYDAGFSYRQNRMEKEAYGEGVVGAAAGGSTGPVAGGGRAGRRL